MMRHHIEKALAAILVMLFLATLLTVIWQVIGRYLLASPSSGTEEIARFLLIWLGMASMTYAFSKRMHVGVDLISTRMSYGARRLTARLIWFACAIFAGVVMVFGGGMLVRITSTLGQTSAALALPMWAIYAIVPMCGLIICYFAFCFLIAGMHTELEVTEGDEPSPAD